MSPSWQRFARGTVVLAAMTIATAPESAWAQDPPKKASTRSKAVPPKQPPEAPPPEPERDEQAPVPETDDGARYVIGIVGEHIMLDLRAADGAIADELVEVWRLVQLKHPATGEVIEEMVMLGRLRLTQVREKLSLALPSGLDMEIVAGDIVRRAPAAVEPPETDYPEADPGAPAAAASVEASAPVAADTKNAAGAASSDSKLGAHLHDGFFLRLGFGPAYFNGAYDGLFEADGLTPPGQIHADIEDVGLTGEVLVGMAPAPGFILAGRFALVVATEPVVQTSEVNEAYPDAEVDAFAVPFIGAAVDIYPDPELGVHFIGSIGMSSASLEGDERLKSRELLGLGYGGGIGFEGFVSDEWSIGIVARVDAALLFATGPKLATDIPAGEDDTVHLVMPTVQMAFTYN